MTVDVTHDFVEILVDGQVQGATVEDPTKGVEVWVEPDLTVAVVQRSEYLEINDNMAPGGSGGGSTLLNTCQFMLPNETPNGVMVDFTLAVDYLPGTLAVYLNGVLLVPTLDYTETSVTGFTLTEAPLAGDYIVAHVMIQTVDAP